ncbi:MAG: hypothetical protein ACOX8E_03225 [Ruminococcus sp.]
MEREKEGYSGFIGYEYKEVAADEGKLSFLIDGYENFGWKIDENVMRGGREAYPERPEGRYRRKMMIRMKRDRRIINKMELTRLQRNFESCVAEIEHLEKEKTSVPCIRSIGIGIVGTAFMAGATFAVTAATPHIILCIILAVPGFLGWILPVLLYRRGVRKQVEKITPLIEAKYDEIYEICKKGNKMIFADER